MYLHCNRIYKHRRTAFLLLIWLLGLSFGMYLALHCSISAFQMLHAVLSVRPSPILAVFVGITPVAITALTIWYPSYAACCIFFAFESICRGFCGMTVSFGLEHSAWLVRPIFLFSASCSSVLMWLLIVRHCDDRRVDFSKDARIALVLACAAALVDTFFITPFLTDLFDYL